MTKWEFNDLWCRKVLHEVYGCRKAVELCHRVICSRDGLGMEIFSPRLPKEATFSLWFLGKTYYGEKNCCSTSASLLVSPCFLIKSTENRNFSRAPFVIELSNFRRIWQQPHQWWSLHRPISPIVTEWDPEVCIAMTIKESLTSLQPLEWKFALPSSVHNAKLSYHRKHKFETTLCH